MEGIIFKALSGFYYVDDGSGTITACRGRGKLRHEKVIPLVGDRVEFTPLDNGQGALDAILPRKNQFARPAVANIDQLVIIASQSIPVTDPFLIDRVIAIAEGNHCESIVCVNKCDLASGAELAALYRRAGYQALEVSAETGEGIDQLKELISGKVSAFTGNSGVGKSSILNALEPGIALKTGEVSDKLGRGRHTTRHVELVRLSCGGVVADTPGFSSFDVDKMELCRKEELAGEGEGVRGAGGGEGGRDRQKPPRELCAPLRAGQADPRLGTEINFFAERLRAFRFFCVKAGDWAIY